MQQTDSQLRREAGIPVISFIVPVYNTQQYLPECIDSVLKQTCPDWEMILVDDGSTDQSGRICDDYSNKDNRIRVIHKANEGQFATRLKGILEATGEYCTGLDSDDYLDTECVERLIVILQNRRYDIVSWNMRIVQDDVIIFEDHKDRYGEYTNAEYLDYVIRSTDHSFCNKLIKTSLLRESSYGDVPLSVRHSEDYILICPAICMSASVMAIDAALYNYRQTEGSVTHTYTGRRILDYLDSTKCVFDIMARYHMLLDERRDMEYAVLVSTIGFCLKSAYRNRSITKKEIEQIKTHPIYQDLKEYENTQYVTKDLVFVLKLFRYGFDRFLRIYYG